METSLLQLLQREDKYVQEYNNICDTLEFATNNPKGIVFLESYKEKATPLISKYREAAHVNFILIQETRKEIKEHFKKILEGENANGKL